MTVKVAQIIMSGLRRGKRGKGKPRRTWNRGVAAAIWSDICKLGNVRIVESGVWVSEGRVFS
jgi:hypothetical protein